MAQAKQTFTIKPDTDVKLLDQLNAIGCHTCNVDEHTLSCIYEKETGPKVVALVRASQIEAPAPDYKPESTGDALDESA